MDKENIGSMLLSETACSVCQTFFRDPVILDCGHNFCDPCVAKCEDFCGRVLCPLCKNPQPSPKQNMKLGTVTELFQQLCARQASREGEICSRHEEPLTLFCTRDKALLCMKCVESMESPAVLGVAEAVQKYKDRYVQYASIIKKEREEIMAHKLSTELRSQLMLEMAEEVKQRMTSAFKEINEFLAQQEKLLLAQLAEIMLDIVKGRDRHVVRLFQRVSLLDSILKEMEKSHQTPNELLKGVKSTLEKFEEEFACPVAFLPVKHWGLYDWHDLTFFLDSAVETFKGALVSGYQMKEVSVTLDPDMGSPQYSLTDGDIRLKQDVPIDLSGSGDVPNLLPYVLGCNVFTTGRHCWEVTVVGEDDWAVGVARSSVRRNGRRSRAVFSPTGGIWAIGKWEGGYAMFSSPKEPVPMNGEVLKRIRVSLNCDGKQVSFANADSGAVLAKFQAASFLGEPLHPIFWVEGNTKLSFPS